MTKDTDDDIGLFFLGTIDKITPEQVGKIAAPKNLLTAY